MLYESSLKVNYTIYFLLLPFFSSFAAPSGAPSIVSLILISTTSLFILWAPPPRSSRNGVITNYTVCLSTPGLPNRTIITSSRRAVFNSLMSNAMYSVRVAAHTSAGIGPFSNTSVVNTPALCKGLL